MEIMDRCKEVWLSFGSNCGDRRKMIEDALSWAAEILFPAESSHIYETPELHGQGAPYLNAVLKGNTSLTMEELNQKLKKYELEAGRDSECRKLGKVPIDIDIVIWENTIIREKDFSSQFFQIGYTSIR